MTKKHFNELAATVKISLQDGRDLEFFASNALITFCCQQNPNFDRQKFLEACGLKNGGNNNE